MSSNKQYQIQHLFHAKVYETGVVVFLPSTGDTIQVDEVSYELLEALRNAPATLAELCAYLAKITDNKLTLSESELMPYINALSSSNLIAVCSEN